MHSRRRSRVPRPPRLSRLITLVLVLSTGYPLPQPYMIGAHKWITWINVSSLVASEVIIYVYAVLTLS